MILPAEVTATTDAPLVGLMARLDVLDKTPGIAGASLLNVQPWLDVEDLGNSIVVVADGDPAAAERAARALAQDFWNLRHAFVGELFSPAEAVRRAVASPGPIVLSDSADATTSGATGDSTAILAEMVKQNVPGPCLVTVVDAEVAAQAHAAGVGARLDVSLGGKYDTLRYKPLHLRVVVESLSDGVFIGKDGMGAGQRFFMGKTAVLRVGGVFIVVMTRPEANRDPELYRSQGLDPATARLVVVKSPTGYRAAYKAIAREMLTDDGPGSTTAHLSAIPFTRLRRPLYPLDDFEHAAKVV
jgi:microcystin degradation protein MlrC